MIIQIKICLLLIQERILETLDALNAGLCVGGAAVTLAGMAVSPAACCIM